MPYLIASLPWFEIGFKHHQIGKLKNTSTVCSIFWTKLSIIKIQLARILSNICTHQKHHQLLQKQIVMFLNNYYFTTLSIILYTCAYNLLLGKMAIKYIFRVFKISRRLSPASSSVSTGDFFSKSLFNFNMQFCFTDLIIIWSFSEAHRFLQYCTSGEHPIPAMK